jgi:hypothetical protein
MSRPVKRIRKRAKKLVKKLERRFTAGKSR